MGSTLATKLAAGNRILPYLRKAVGCVLEEKVNFILDIEVT